MSPTSLAMINAPDDGTDADGRRASGPIFTTAFIV